MIRPAPSAKNTGSTAPLLAGLLVLLFTAGAIAQTTIESERGALISKLREARHNGDLETYAKLEAHISHLSGAARKSDEASSVYYLKSGAISGPGDPRFEGFSGGNATASRGSFGVFGPDIHVRNSNPATYEINQSMATDSSGNIYVAFQTNITSPGHFYIQLYWSADEGMTWQAYGYILATDISLRDPCLAIGEGPMARLIVAYIVDDAVNVFYPEVATAPLGSPTFTTHSVPLWSGGYGWTKPVLWTDSIHYNDWFTYLTCERLYDITTDNYNVDFWRSTDFAVTFGSTPKVICGNYDSEAWLDPDGAYGSPPHNRVFVICYNRDQEALFKVTSDDFGVTFTSETLLHNLYTHPSNPVDPEVAMSPDKSTVMIACTYKSGGGDDNIGYKYSYDGGEYWSVFLTLNGVTPDPEFGATLHASEGGQSWHLAYNRLNEIYYNRRPQDNSGLWTAEPLLVNDTNDASIGFCKKGLTSNWTTDRPGIAWADNRDGGIDYDTYFDTEYATDIYVPDDYPTIQAAVDAAFEGFTIHVKPDTYVENVDFKGKNVMVVSTDGPNVTVIDGNQSGSVVSFTNLNQQETVLEGFTITNGKAGQGGGLYCAEFASPVIKGNVIKNNNAKSGGGMWCEKFQSVVTENIFEDNTALESGGGIFCSTLNSTLSEFTRNQIRNNSAGSAYGGGGGVYSVDGFPTFINNVVAQNTANNGGGILVVEAGVKMINNTIAGNGANVRGGGIYCDWCVGTVRNTIVFGNNAPSDPQLYFWNSSPTLDYCDVEGGATGTGNIDKDPEFFDPSKKNYHLTWISPCINMGTAATAPEEDMDGQLRPQAGTVDIGADEFMGIHLLEADAYDFSQQLGCKINFLLEAGPGNGGRQYLVLGGVTGKVPGMPLPGGKTVLPVNYDLFTGIVMGGLNGPLFQNFLGFLDGTGYAKALFYLPPVPGSAGAVLSFAYTLKGPPWDFVSNPIDIMITK